MYASFISLIAALLLIIPTASSQWKMVKERDNLKVFTMKPAESKFKAVRIEAKVEASLSAVVRALEDIDAHKEWVMRADQAFLVEEIDEATFVYYVSIDMPMTLANRDLVVYYERFQDPNTQTVQTRSYALPEHIPSKEGYVRIPYFDSTYTLTSTEDGWVEIAYEVVMDPGGSLPAWVANLAATKGPITSITGLLDLIASGRYDDVQVAGISDFYQNSGQ